MQPDFRSRIKKLRALMDSKGLDACLVNSRNDIFYYTGKDIGDSCFLLVPKNSMPTLFITSLSNEVQSSRHFHAVFLKGFSDVSKAVKYFHKVGFDEYTTNYAFFSQLRKSRPHLRPSASLIKEPRMVKDAWETVQIRKVADIAAKTLSGLGDISSKSEIEVSISIESSFMKAEAKPSFETIVASGKHSGFIHHVPDKNRIKRSDLTIVDLGAIQNGYCSDMTRTLCMKPGSKERAIMENISQIQSELIDMAAPGVKYDDIQKRFESLLKRKRYKVMHSFGHGIGTGVHERPSKGDVLKEGMVITVEPGTYIKSFGGCRIEDMIIIRKGKPDVITRKGSGTPD
jgi:Xaa-Pro aminopeptidase